jgi:Cytochrome C oxidase, cbb3-type, subunit III
MDIFEIPIGKFIVPLGIRGLLVVNSQIPSGWPLRVCADPNNLPYSDAKGAGFENKIAQVVATDLGADLSYFWFAQRRGFVRNTLNANVCDVVIGIPADMHMLCTTKPYYRSGYVFVQREDRPLITSFDDPNLKHLKAMNCTGCHANGGGGFGPALMGKTWIYGGSVENIASTIVEGRPNGMPSFRSLLPMEQVWELAAYVESLSDHQRRNSRAERLYSLLRSSSDAGRGRLEP